MERSVQEDPVALLADAAELIGRWDFPAACAVLERLVAGTREDSLDGLTSRRMLAEVLRELGGTDRAFELAVAASDGCTRRYGADHPSSVRASVVLATVRHDRGELDEAARLYTAVVERPSRADGPTTRAVLLARANLALLRRDRGDPDTAIREMAAAYAAHRRAFGGGDLETIRLGAELGRLHIRAGDLAAARRLLAVAHAAARGALGEEHPLTAAIEDALAEIEAPMPSAPVELDRPRRGRRWPASLRALHPARPRGPRRARVAGRAGSREPRRAWVAGRVGLRGPRRAWVAGRAGSREPRDARVAGPAGSRRSWTPRRPSAIVVAGACLGVLLVVAAVGLALAYRGAPGRVRAATPGASASGTTAPRAAPRDVRLADAGTSITVSWTDPSGGTAPVLLAIAPAGQPTGPLQSMPPGTHERRITGLDAARDYCVVLAVVYPGDSAAQAAQACTHRHNLVDTGHS